METEPAVQTPAQNPSPLPYASVSSRIWATILDLIACYLLCIIALLAMVAIPSDLDYFGAVFTIVFVGIPWLYFAGFEASAARATPGKRLARIVVTDAQGARISFARASVRFLAKLLVMLTTLGLGLLTAVFDRQRRGLDDWIAGTRVHDVEALARGGPRPWWKKAIGPLMVAAFIGVLAKVAIDAQNDFKQRSRVAQLMYAVQTGLQEPYVTYYQANGRTPKTSDLPFSHPQVRAAEVDAGGALAIRLSEPEGAVLHLTPAFDQDGAATWACRVDAAQVKWFPARCRP